MCYLEPRREISVPEFTLGFVDDVAATRRILEDLACQASGALAYPHLLL